LRESIFKNNLRSSVNRRKWQWLITFLILLINNAKSKGERWPPWGTPEVASIKQTYNHKHQQFAYDLDDTTETKTTMVH